MTPYAHLRAALAASLATGRQGVMVLPTGSGKTCLVQLALQQPQQSTLVVVPTADLMHQWYAPLLATFLDASVGLLGGGSHDRTPLLVATYDSAAIHAEALDNHDVRHDLHPQSPAPRWQLDEGFPERHDHPR